jgi:hypothetical protein
MRRFLCTSVILALSAAAPAAADLREARIAPAADGARIWFAFDEQPRDARLVMTQEGAMLDVLGVSSQARAIEPASGPFAAIRVAPEQGGARLSLTGGPALTDARAELREGGVLVVLHFDAPVFAPAQTSAVAYDAAGATAAPESAPAASPASRAVAGPVAGPVASAPANGPVQLTEIAAPHAEDDAAPVEIAAAPAAETAAPAPAVAVTDPDAEIRAMAQTVCAGLAEAVEADPWDFLRLADHGACLEEAGDVAAAKEIYERVLAFEPEHYDAAYALAAIRETEGDTSSARTLYARAASSARSDSEAAAAWARARALAPR